MSKIENTIKVLRLLRKNGKMTSEELANELGVDKRMIMRYIASLVKCGYNIEGKPGRRSGGYTLHEVNLTNEEYIALYEAKELLRENKPHLLELYEKALEKINYRLNDAL